MTLQIGADASTIMGLVDSYFVEYVNKTFATKPVAIPFILNHERKIYFFRKLVDEILKTEAIREKKSKLFDTKIIRSLAEALFPIFCYSCIEKAEQDARYHERMMDKIRAESGIKEEVVDETLGGEVEWVDRRDIKL